MGDEFRRSVEYQKNANGFRNDITKEELKNHYCEFSKNGTYERYLSLDRYKAPIRVTEIMTKFLGVKRRSAKILDCAAGTGYMGQLLWKEGYRNLHALEPSRGMADVAREKNVYASITEDFVDENYSPFGENSFDVLVCVGSFGAGHIPAKALKEMIRIVKPRGYIFISFREEYADDCADLEPYMKVLEEKGKWSMVSRVVYPEHFFNLNGVCAIFEVL